jgi:hypothetical protein
MKVHDKYSRFGPDTFQDLPFDVDALPTTASLVSLVSQIAGSINERRRKLRKLKKKLKKRMKRKLGYQHICSLIL